MSALDGLFGLRTILLNGVPKSFKQTLNFLGGWTITPGTYVDDAGKTIETLELTPPGGGGGGTGDFVGPGSSIADRLVAFNGTTGKLGKDSGYTIASVLAAALTAAQTYANSVGATVTGLIPSAGSAPPNVTKAAAAAGASSNYARQDHKHDVDTAAPGAFSVSGVAAAEGTSTSLARADHTHSLLGKLPWANVADGTSKGQSPVWNGASWVFFGVVTKATDLANAAATLSVSAGNRAVLAAGTLSANRIGTFDVSGVDTTYGKDIYTIERYDVSGFTYTVKSVAGTTLYVFPASTKGMASFQYQVASNDWVLVSHVGMTS